MDTIYRNQAESKLDILPKRLQYKCQHHFIINGMFKTISSLLNKKYKQWIYSQFLSLLNDEIRVNYRKPTNLNNGFSEAASELLGGGLLIFFKHSAEIGRALKSTQIAYLQYAEVTKLQIPNRDIEPHLV